MAILEVKFNLYTSPELRLKKVIFCFRLNPIFVEEDIRKSGLCERSGAGKSGSSGYESQRSSSGWSGEEDTLDHPLGQNKNTPLSTIPEGQVDYCIPRPIWPRYEDRQRKPPTVRVDRGTLRKMRRPERRVQVHPGEEMLERSPYDLLRELSLAINMAVDRSSKELPAEEILRDIGHKINKSLDALTAQNSYQGRTFEEKTKTNRISSERLSSEHALRRLSVNLSRSEQVVAVGRALSHSGSSGSDSDLEAGRLSLLRKLGRFPAPEPLYNHSQGSTSSTSSGFSDLTPTPPSSASASASSRPVFLHENPVSVPTRVRNAMIYETLQCRVPGGYEKLRLDQRIELDRQWTICEKEATHAITEKHEKCVSTYSFFLLCNISTTHGLFIL